MVGLLVGIFHEYRDKNSCLQSHTFNPKFLFKIMTSNCSDVLYQYTILSVQKVTIVNIPANNGGICRLDGVELQFEVSLSYLEGIYS